MKKIITAVLFAFVLAGLVFARSSKAPPASLSDADTLRQLERDWADASKKVDVNWISQTLGRWLERRRIEGHKYDQGIHSKPSANPQVQT